MLLTKALILNILWEDKKHEKFCKECKVCMCTHIFVTLRPPHMSWGHFCYTFSHSLTRKNSLARLYAPRIVLYKVV